MSKELFGTDGIRGEVGRFPLTQDAVYSIGISLSKWLNKQFPEKAGRQLKLVLGKDTRESGDDLERALLTGVRENGVEPIRLGTTPTPTVAFLTKALQAQLGVAISASHNPGSDNGIKFFNANGHKLFPEQEKQIEQLFAHTYPCPIKENVAQKQEEEFDYFPIYLDFVKQSLEGSDLSGLTIVIDCAYGSFSHVAPKIFRTLGAKVIALHDKPDGTNINVNCGTLYPQLLSREIVTNKANVGIAFDGDGDRLMIGDEKGNILDGDNIMAILGIYFSECKRLKNNLIISTHMTNIGLEIFFEQHGIHMHRTNVGDKYVLQEMLTRKATLGGEQSGHIILLERSTTGDGLIAALEVLKVMKKKNKPISQLEGGFRRYPQLLVNIKVKEKPPFNDIPGFEPMAAKYRKQLGKSGRLYIRYSGTEKLARVMVEGREQNEVEQIAHSLADLIRKAIGA